MRTVPEMRLRTVHEIGRARQPNHASGASGTIAGPRRQSPGTGLDERTVHAMRFKDQAARARCHARSRTQQMLANFRATATRATFRPARRRTR